MNISARGVNVGTGLSVKIEQDGLIPFNATFDCAPGELLALVGPSGSGKSTLLRCIAGLYTSPKGRVAMNNEAWFDSTSQINLTPQQRSTGFVFQHYALFPHMSALANIEAAMGHRANADRAARAREFLSLVNLNELGHRRPAELSGGQQQRVAVARALARDPAVLLLDEPFSAVDRATRQKLYVELAKLRGQLQMPMILVTHDLHEAALLADRMCILHLGKTLQIGSPLEVMTRPNTPEVARLIDIKNIFEGRILRHDHERKLSIITWHQHTLAARYCSDVTVGEPVSWALPMECVILPSHDGASIAEPENLVSGQITEYVALGSNVSVGISIDGVGEILHMSVPTHIANRHQLGMKKTIQVSLLAEGIHVMKPEMPG